MRRRGNRGRQSFEERLKRNHAGLSFMARMHGHEPPPEPQMLRDARERREAREARRRTRDAHSAVHSPRPSVPLERDVLADVLQALRNDPRIALVERTQSGVFQEGDRYIRVGTKGKLDITLMLVGGRYGEIEVKRPGKEPDERQAERIQAIKRNGGIAGYAWSAESALALLP